MGDDEYYSDDFEDGTPPPTPPPSDVPAPIYTDYDDGGALQSSPTQSFPWSLVTMDELDVCEKLAAGAMGAVHSGFYRGRPVAIKTLVSNRFTDLESHATCGFISCLLVPCLTLLLSPTLLPPVCVSHARVVARHEP